MGGRGRNTRRNAGKYVTTRSGRILKVHRSLGERWAAMREGKSLRKVSRMRGLPKSRAKRVLWHMDPRHLAEYWFSRDGAISGLKIMGIAIVVLFILTLGVFAYFRKDLPNIKDISGSKLGGSISYYDRSGQTLLWQDYDAVKRVPVEGSNMSQYLKDATVAVEDRDFYKHRGFDIRGIARAAFNDLFKHGAATQGGSTITQQLVKLNQDWTQQRSFIRKIKELILAVELERSYTKEEILTGYLNAAPYGSVDYGVQTAASDYFHKSAKDLTLAESTMLVSIPKSPAIYSPYSPDFDKQALIGRQHYILDILVQSKKITKAQAEDAKKVDVLAEIQPQQTKYAGIKSPYFVLSARDELKNKFVPTGGGGSTKIGGWKVITTLNMDLQSKAEKIVADNQANVRRYGADEQALVTEDIKTGQMVALVGGVDFNDPDHGQLNYAHEVKIAPGSSFKPYDYASMIENTTNTGAGSVLYDQQGPIPGYPCTKKGLPPPKGTSNCLQDYDFRYPGPLSLRYALGGSRNVPAVKAMLTVGVDKTINMANSLMNAPGAYNCYEDTALTKKTQCYGASAIGDGAFLHLDQHVNGVASLGRMGQAIPSTYILKIEDAANKTIYEWKQPKAQQVVKAETAYIVNNMASDPNASYLPSGFYKWHRYNGWNNAIKTGTTNNGFDGLMMGWNTQFAVGSWVGYHNRERALSGAMEYMTTPLTRNMMLAALDSLKTTPVNWQEPSGIQHLPGFVVTGHVGIGSVEPSPSTEIFPSWYKQKGNTSSSATTDKVSNKLATDCTPGLAKQTASGNSSAEHFSADIFFGSGAANSGTSSQDDVHNCSDSKPAITLTTTNNNDGSYTLTATATAGTHPFNDSNYAQFPGTINFTVDGQVVKSFTDLTDSPTTRSYNYTASGGSHTVTAQVIDSVLYDSTSDPATINFSQGQSQAPLTFVSAKATGGSTTINWSGGSGPYTVKNGSTTVCQTGSTSCTAPVALAPKSSTVTVTDDEGDSVSGSVN